MNTAKMAARLAGGDGQQWTGPDGRTLDAICRHLGANVSTGDGVHIEGREAPVDPQWIRYLFDDGSAIVDCINGWDIEGSTPWSWEGAEGFEPTDEEWDDLALWLGLNGRRGGDDG